MKLSATFQGSINSLTISFPFPSVFMDNFWRKLTDYSHIFPLDFNSEIWRFWTHPCCHIQHIHNLVKLIIFNIIFFYMGRKSSKFIPQLALGVLHDLLLFWRLKERNLESFVMNRLSPTIGAHPAAPYTPLIIYTEEYNFKYISSEETCCSRWFSFEFGAHSCTWNIFGVSITANFSLLLLREWLRVTISHSSGKR